MAWRVAGARRKEMNKYTNTGKIRCSMCPEMRRVLAPSLCRARWCWCGAVAAEVLKQ
ncbi:hypothetical protein KCP74_00610 [Salmonella enterica subsp. enterica]|nr:hypothetical protein KCP74_00610 [Salmonella enterica subsp. enterica]